MILLSNKKLGVKSYNIVDKFSLKQIVIMIC